MAMEDSRRSKVTPLQSLQSTSTSQYSKTKQHIKPASLLLRSQDLVLSRSCSQDLALRTSPSRSCSQDLALRTSPSRSCSQDLALRTSPLGPRPQDLALRTSLSQDLALITSLSGPRSLKPSLSGPCSQDLALSGKCSGCCPQKLADLAFRTLLSGPRSQNLALSEPRSLKPSLSGSRSQDLALRISLSGPRSLKEVLRILPSEARWPLGYRDEALLRQKSASVEPETVEEGGQLILGGRETQDGRLPSIAEILEDFPRFYSTLFYSPFLRPKYRSLDVPRSLMGTAGSPPLDPSLPSTRVLSIEELRERYKDLPPSSPDVALGDGRRIEGIFDLFMECPFNYHHVWDFERFSNPPCVSAAMQNGEITEESLGAYIKKTELYTNEPHLICPVPGCMAIDGSSRKKAVIRAPGLIHHLNTKHPDLYDVQHPPPNLKPTEDGSWPIHCYFKSCHLSFVGVEKYLLREFHTRYFHPEGTVEFTIPTENSSDPNLYKTFVLFREEVHSLNWPIDEVNNLTRDDPAIEERAIYYLQRNRAAIIDLNNRTASSQR
ncbi:hypothetical protein BJ508DRAFT_313285 [Ascobolus immersus RN42]|uniref:Uncharacterized protein n=1 Tax=Ascobolus immersus RN42 TaxID=1160509 RepID=A0A3N4HJ98_ASCIM|nr:hypothetical protein BJ508DRAFT_313285 [Ascobolus immersus RN42]